MSRLQQGNLYRIDDVLLRAGAVTLVPVLGATALDVAVASRAIPRCPYCQDPVSAESLQERRRKALDTLRAESRAQRTPIRAGSRLADGHVGREARIEGSGFSLALFLVLLCVFWPGAVGYAIWKWNAG